MKPLVEMKENLRNLEKDMFYPLAAYSCDAIRRHPEEAHFSHITYRLEFAVDADRILHADAYTRYMGKTQVFSLPDNDQVSYRLLHVQLVSKVARTIGRYLGLNTDLIEAIALGHDIGHPPFGHMGEHILSDICTEMGIGPFHHNEQSLRFLDRIEKKGRGLNLTLQVLDGIFSHDGEVNQTTLTPDFRTPPTFDRLDEKIHNLNHQLPYDATPITLEGCVMRLSDTIAYVGRDIEDAIRMKLIEREDLPKEATQVLGGNTNGTIVHTLVTDLIQASYHQPYIRYSDEVAEALLRLKKFNYDRIYLHPMVQKNKAHLQRQYQRLFEQYMNDLATQNQQSVIYKDFLHIMDESYLRESAPIMVRDFIAGMTDRYFLKQTEAFS